MTVSNGEDQSQKPQGTETNINTRNLAGENPEQAARSALTRRLFLIKSSQEKMNHPCIEFLLNLGFQYIDLNIKEFEDKQFEEVINNFHDIKFAVVLLSGDNFIYPKENGKPSTAMLCSAQNIVFKLGCLIGVLGKHNVFILYHEQKSYLLPTKFYNAIFTEWDKYGLWQKTLKDCLKLAGYTLKDAP